MRPLQPCRACGGPKEARRGARLCLACAAAAARRPKARGTVVAQRQERRPCLRCGAPKGARRIRYCDPCADDLLVPRCRRCHTRPVRGPRRQMCEECAAWYDDQARARDAALRKPCAGCDGPKDAGQGCAYCAACRERRAAKRRCQGCGGAKEPGAGRRLCPTCPRVGGARPCRKCGSTAPKAKPGQRFCDDCAEVEHWRAEHKRRAVRAMLRKPCRGCGKPKGAGRRVYCDPCIAKRQAPRWCGRCGERPIRGHGKKYCAVCVAEAAVRRRAWELAYLERKRRDDPGFEQRQREWSRESHTRRKRRGGRRRHALPKVRRLPALPLALAVDGIVQLEQAGGEWGAVERENGNGAGKRVIVCERAGISDRTLRAWLDGERHDVQFDVADRVLQRLDLVWWAVWAEDDDAGVHALARSVWAGERRVAA